MTTLSPTLCTSISTRTSICTSITSRSSSAIRARAVHRPVVPRSLHCSFHPLALSSSPPPYSQLSSPLPPKQGISALALFPSTLKYCSSNSTLPPISSSTLLPSSAFKQSALVYKSNSTRISTEAPLSLHSAQKPISLAYSSLPMCLPLPLSRSPSLSNRATLPYRPSALNRISLSNRLSPLPLRLPGNYSAVSCYPAWINLSALAHSGSYRAVCRHTLGAVALLSVLLPLSHSLVNPRARWGAAPVHPRVFWGYSGFSSAINTSQIAHPPHSKHTRASLPQHPHHSAKAEAETETEAEAEAEAKAEAEVEAEASAVAGTKVESTFPRGIPERQRSMAWLGGAHATNDQLVASLQRMGIISTERVSATMRAVDRKLFVGTRQEGAFAYADSPQPIGYNATISAPHMHAQCLDLLEPFLRPGGRALDVGSGTGYLTACFALMLGQEGKAVGVEHIPELVEMSVRNVRSCAASRPLLESGALELHAADGRKGWQEHAPYNAIHVGAAAASVPKPLLDQLAPGGRMVIPVGTYFQNLRVIDKRQDGTLREYSAADVRYVPLTDKDMQMRGA